MNPRQLAAAATSMAHASPFFETYRSELITARPAKGYVVFWFTTGSVANQSLAARPNRLRWSFMVTCVGYSDDHCLYVTEKVRALFSGVRLDPSRAASPLNEVDEDVPIIRDDVEGDVRYSIRLKFDLYTNL